MTTIVHVSLFLAVAAGLTQSYVGIGQCVGARNHKFFVNFLEWAAIFCTWTFGTMIAGAVQEGRDDDLDAQYIVIIAL